MRRSWIIWIPVLGCLSLIAIYGFYYLVLGPETGGDGDRALRLEAARVAWAASSMILNVVMLGCVVCSFWVVRIFAWPKLSRWQRLVGCVVTAAIILAGMIIIARTPVTGQEGQDILFRLFSNVDGLVHIITANNLSGVVVLIGLLLAAVSILIDASDDDEETLSKRLQWFRITLYSAGTLAALALYQFIRLYLWAAQFGAEATRDAVQSLATTTAISSGMMVSCFLALVFLPSALVLNSRFNLLVVEAAKSEDKFDRSTWMARHNLGSSPMASLGSYVAVFLPTVTGFITKFVELVA